VAHMRRGFRIANRGSLFIAMVVSEPWTSKARQQKLQVPNIGLALLTKLSRRQPERSAPSDSGRPNAGSPSRSISVG